MQEGGNGLRPSDAAAIAALSDRMIASSIQSTMDRLHTRSLPVALIKSAASADLPLSMQACIHLVSDRDVLLLPVDRVIRP